MRKVLFGVANSLDNYIARPDGGVDWLDWDDEVSAIIAEFWKTIDTVVMGRKTYEIALRSGTSAYPGVRNIIFSRTLTQAPDPNVEIVSADADGFIRDLRNQEGKDICVMGGGDLARSLFASELIDEVHLNIHPVLLGSGVPLFHGMNRHIDLALIECRPLKNGCVVLSYRVVR